MRRRRSQGWIFQRENGNWYIGYFADGKKVREVAGPRKSDAVALLTRRTAEVDAGRWLPNKPLSLADVFGWSRPIGATVGKSRR